MILNKTIKFFFTAFVFSAFAALVFPAWAQWKWLDKDGRTVFSDRSPPPEIAEKNILQRPSGGARKLLEFESPATAASAAKPSSVKLAPKVSSKDSELMAKKKQAEEQDAAAKKAEEEKNAQAKSINCERAKSNLTTLQSGIRIATVNAKGEREFLDEAKLAQETKRVEETIQSNCK
jgi:hypothetical protein